MEYVVLTGMGPDRSGIVNTLSGFLLDCGANIEDSRMAVLGEQFAVILLASGEAGIEAKLKPGLAEIEKSTGLSIGIKPTAAPTRSKPGMPCEISAVALDHPGIVHSLSHAVSQKGANVESLESSCSPAPLTGSPLFTLKMVCSLPKEIAFGQFKEALEQVGKELGVDLTVRLLKS